MPSRANKHNGELARRSEYEPLNASDLDAPGRDSLDLQDSTVLPAAEPPFSWLEYSIFILLGIAMLWAWNMFLAAAPYFASRFAASPAIQSTFQPSILAVSTVTNLITMILLAQIQQAASYPFRINLALTINIVVFGLLTCSTVLFLDVSPNVYLGFLLVMVGSSSWATGLIQNGAFAFAGSFGRREYMQALMAGQGIAGVLPPVAQVLTVVIFPPSSSSSDEAVSGGKSSAFLYFLAAVVISLVTLVAFVPLVRRHNHIIESRLAEQLAESVTSLEEAERAARKSVSLWRLFGKLRWLALALALTFTETMFFPVFTTKITSVNEGQDSSIWVRPEAFIPLGFLLWNIGDLGGRLSTALPFSLRDRPSALFMLSVARAAWIPLYFLCNIGGRGAVVSSDLFYLLVVQLLYGLTNGWLGSSCMMASGDWVDEGEREAAGGFMGLCLVIGLTVGSILSFSLARI